MLYLIYYANLLIKQRKIEEFHRQSAFRGSGRTGIVDKKLTLMAVDRINIVGRSSLQ